MSDNTLGDLTNNSGLTDQQNHQSLPLGEKSHNIKEALRQKLDFKNSVDGKIL